MKTLIVLALFATTICLTKSQVRYDDFKVFRVTPKNMMQLSSLRQMQETLTSYNFWTDVNGLDTPVDILVSPQLKYDFQDIIKNLDLDAEVMIENVQELIEAEKTSSPKSGRAYDWKRYLTLNEIHDWLRSFAAQNPDVVTVVKGGSSYEGREILGVKLTFNAANKDVIIEGGIHAREWIAPATVTYLANELVNSKDPAVRKVAESFNWHIFPSVNPDGYVYTHTTNRIWRKTRKPYGLCYGADPNRNWGYKWLQGGASSSPCFDTYAGSSAFSEIETKSLSEYISKIVDNVEAYLAFHSYSQLLLIPYGHAGLEVPENNDELHTVGKNAVAALAQRYGTQYKVGNIPEAIYVASGGSMDWALSTNRNMRLAYTYELRDTGRHGFILPPEQIIPNSEEVLDSLVSMFQQIL